MIHDPSLTSTQNRVIRFEVRSVFNRDYFLKCHLAILAKLHCPKGGRINESLLYLPETYHSICDTSCLPHLRGNVRVTVGGGGGVTDKRLHPSQTHRQAYHLHILKGKERGYMYTIGLALN